ESAARVLKPGARCREGEAVAAPAGAWAWTAAAAKASASSQNRGASDARMRMGTAPATAPRAGPESPAWKSARIELYAGRRGGPARACLVGQIYAPPPSFHAGVRCEQQHGRNGHAG